MLIYTLHTNTCDFQADLRALGNSDQMMVRQTTVVDNSLSGVQIARELDQIAEMRGLPNMVVSDNGTELTSNAILKWQPDRQIEWHYIAPGKPMQNGFVESFNGRLRWADTMGIRKPVT